jgi:hypothetical protein
VGDVDFLGQRDYSMRVWLDPIALQARNLDPSDVVRAIREQNAQVAAGAVGAQPTDAPFQLTVDVRGRLSDPAEFAAITIRTLADGRQIRLGEVARVEIGASTYAFRSLLSLKNPDGTTRHLNRTAAAMPIFQAPDSNALAVSGGVRARIKMMVLPYGEVWVRQAEYVKQALRRVGIDVTLESNDAGGWVKRIVDARGRYRTEPAYQTSVADFTTIQGIVGQMAPNFAGLGIDIATTPDVTQSGGAYQGFALAPGGIGWARASTAGVLPTGVVSPIYMPEIGVLIAPLASSMPNATALYVAWLWLGLALASTQTHAQKRILSVV